MPDDENNIIDAIVIGTSAGGLEALTQVFANLPKDYPVPILVVIHLPPDKVSLMADIFNDKCDLNVVEAMDKQPIEPGHIYFAPPNYHMMVEHGGSIALSSEEAVRYSRPSIDVLFETAADAYRENLLGIILTGANNDGANGLKQIMAQGGSALIQDPNTAEMDAMPIAAAKKCPHAGIANLQAINTYIKQIVKGT